MFGKMYVIIEGLGGPRNFEVRAYRIFFSKISFGVFERNFGAKFRILVKFA